jgi:hypothetical protein
MLQFRANILYYSSLTDPLLRLLLRRSVLIHIKRILVIIIAYLRSANIISESIKLDFKWLNRTFSEQIFSLTSTGRFVSFLFLLLHDLRLHYISICLLSISNLFLSLELLLFELLVKFLSLTNDFFFFSDLLFLLLFDFIVLPSLLFLHLLL